MKPVAAIKVENVTILISKESDSKLVSLFSKIADEKKRGEASE